MVKSSERSSSPHSLDSSSSSSSSESDDERPVCLSHHKNSSAPVPVASALAAGICEAQREGDIDAYLTPLVALVNLTPFGPGRILTFHKVESEHFTHLFLIKH